MSFDYSTHYNWRNSYKWKAIRKQILARDNYQCQVGNKGCKGHATTVDHITPVDLAPVVGMTPLEANSYGNLRAACTKCNYSLGARYRNAKHSHGYELKEPKPLKDFNAKPFVESGHPRDYKPNEYTTRGFNPHSYNARTGMDSKGVTPDGSYFNPRWFDADSIHESVMRHQGT